jgi:CRP-like cAMP-binding protein
MDLRAAPLFSHFTRDQLVLLGTCGQKKKFASGIKLLQANHRGDPAILLKGKVRLYRDTPYGPFELGKLSPGSMIGEAGLLESLPSTVDASAASEIEALVLDRDKVLGLMESNKGFKVALYWSIWKSLSQKLRDCNDRLTHFFSQSPPPPNPEPAQNEPSGEFKIDIEAKRAVFREQKLANMEINFLASLSKAKRLKPNEVLFREGEPGDRMYVVVEGRIMISKDIPGAGEEALAFLERGEILGEMALIDHQPRSADAKADKDGAIVLSIHQDVLEKILNVERQSSSRLLEVLCLLIARRLRETHEKIVGWYILSGGASAQA